MAPLRLVLPAALVAWATPAAADSVERWSVYIAEASQRFGVPEAWIRRVMRAESGGRTTLRGMPITSSAGAQGLMQIMPGTWRDLRAAHRLGADPHDPRDNILVGTAYLRAMYDRFGHPGLFAAYNAGPARYAEHLARGRRLPAETIAYVAQVTGTSRPVSRAWTAPGTTPAPAADTAPPSLFAIRIADPPDDGGAGQVPSPRGHSLFFALRGRSGS